MAILNFFPVRLQADFVPGPKKRKPRKVKRH